MAEAAAMTATPSGTIAATIAGQGTGISETPGLRVTGGHAPAMVTLKADLAAADTVAALEAVTGAAMPAALTATMGEGPDGPVAVVWMAPDEVLILAPSGRADALVEALGSRLAGGKALALDMSSARAVFRLEGPRWREVLAKGAPIDLRPAAFGPGTARRTHLGRVAVGFWADPDAAEAVTLVCFRSVGDYVTLWLAEAASAEGAVGLFEGA